MKTTVPLYRQGNALSPRMDHVRENKDVATIEENKVIWVVSNLAADHFAKLIVSSSPGGISTFANPGKGKNWWRLEAGVDIPKELQLTNDHDNHWLWQPSHTMTLDTYKEALRSIGELFRKINEII